MIKIIYVLIAVAVLLGISSIFISKTAEAPKVLDTAACAMDVMSCPDGTSVGRSGPKCEFACTPVSETGKENLIKLDSVLSGNVITSPLKFTGEARGYWYFEGSFPVMLTNWDGLIIAEGHATAEGDWMTEEFVPFTVELSFVNPYSLGNPDFMKRGSLILKKDNPSDLPENDDALEILVHFAP